MWRLAAIAAATWCLALPGRLAAQHRVASLIERHVARDDGGDTVRLKGRTLYWAELTGPGTPVVEAESRVASPPLLVPVGDQSALHRRFEIHPYSSGLYRITVDGLAPGDSTLLRFYRGVRGRRGRDAVGEDDDRFAIGAAFSYGRHSGFRLDPTGGANPRGGADVEGALIFAPAGRFEMLLGVSSEALPDAGYHVTWGFAEGTYRIFARTMLGGRHADLRAALRYSKGFSAGTRSLSPALLGIGIDGVVVVTPGRERGGLSLDLGWMHERLGNAPETELLDSDRFSLGLRWIP